MSRRIAVYYPFKGSLPRHLLGAVQDLARQKGYLVVLVAFGLHKNLWRQHVHRLSIFLRLAIFRYIYERFFLLRMLRGKNIEMVILPFSKGFHKQDMPFCLFFYKVCNVLQQRRLNTHMKKLIPYKPRWISDRSILLERGARQRLSTSFISVYDPSTYFKDNATSFDTKGRTSIKSPFFLCYCPASCAIGDVIYLLKAFSWLKKRHKSNIKLVLCIDARFPIDRVRLSMYKYEKDVRVHVVSGIEKCRQWYCAAYAVIYPFDVHDSFDIPAIRFGLSVDAPLIVAEDAYTKELVQDAGLLFDRKNISSLASAMNKVFINECFRDKMIAASQALRKERLHCIEKLSQLIEKEL